MLPKISRNSASEVIVAPTHEGVRHRFGQQSGLHNGQSQAKAQ